MKYKLGEKHPDKELYRIVALKDFGDVKTDDFICFCYESAEEIE